MAQLLHSLHGALVCSELGVFDDSRSRFASIKCKSLSTRIGILKKNRCIKSSVQGRIDLFDRVTSSPKRKAGFFGIVESEGFPPVQTLSRIPKEELVGKVVLVRFDSTALLGKEPNLTSQSVSSTVYAIKYLLELGNKVILASDWSEDTHPEPLVAGIVSSVLQCKVVMLHSLSSGVALKRETLETADAFLLENLSKFKGEVANCPQFSGLLASGADIFVNDVFSQSHKVLASTIGVTRFCHGCMAGFHFEECLCQLQNTAKANRRPFVSIIGGGNLYDKASALKFLASTCDGLIFVGEMSFQIMHALGQGVPSNLFEPRACEAARDIVQLARVRNIPILYPKDFWCTKDYLGSHLEIFPAHAILRGWTPVDLGPRSLEEIDSSLRKCEKVIWIGPVKFRFSSSKTKGESLVAQMLCKLNLSGSDTTVIGSTACNAISKETSCISRVNIVESASVAWEFLKGRRLPAVWALDRAYPYKIDWEAAYCSPARPLVVDIGSGNGLFIFGMAAGMTDLNFLGLEINGKLVKRCLNLVHQRGFKNGYFIETNATSTFRSIVSSYPGKLVLVSIQCPNPDFKKPEHRWRMLQRSLVEAVADLLACDGKVFLQSDVKAVALRMKEQFLQYAKGKLVLMHDQKNPTSSKQAMWLHENPFGVRSDWEQHVLDRGKPMYRLMLSKTDDVKRNELFIGKASQIYGNRRWKT